MSNLFIWRQLDFFCRALNCVSLLRSRRWVHSMGPLRLMAPAGCERSKAKL
jgi:hypothetical protein